MKATYKRPPGLKSVPAGKKFTGSAAPQHGCTAKRTAKTSKR